MERQVRRRRRPMLSCMECRRRKIKCDRNEPCNHCTATKSQCQFRLHGTGSERRQQVKANSRVALSPPGTDTTPESRSIGAECRESPTELRGTARNEPTRVPNEDCARTSLTISGIPKDTDAFSPSQNNVQERSPQQKRSLVFQHEPGSHIGLYKTRTMTSSHWMATAPEFGTIYDCYRLASDKSWSPAVDEEIQRKAVEFSSLLRSCKEAAQSVKRHRPRGHISLDNDSLRLPSKSEADEAVALYFSHWESTYRILHESTFMAEYEKFYSQPGPVKAEQRLLIGLAISAGSSIASGSPTPYQKEAAAAWAHAGQSWLSGPLEKSRLCVAGVQIYCLTLLVQQAWSIVGDMLWLSSGTLVQTAMQVGLHRDPKHLPSMSALHTEVRRRLWATVVEMAVQFSLDAAMPARVRLEDFDTQAPSNLDDQDLNDSKPSLPECDPEAYTQSTIQRLLLESLPTRLQIVEHLHGLSSEMSYSRTLSLSSEVERHLQSNFERLSKISGNEDLNFRRTLLDYLVRRFLIPLHRPFASAAANNRLFFYSVEVCLNAALMVFPTQMNERFARLLTAGGSAFREGILCANTVISLELISRTQAQRKDGTLGRMFHSRDHLKNTLEALKVRAKNRILAGETNIKNHLFIHMVLAQVEALETNQEPMSRILDSAISSLTLCKTLIENQASHLTPSRIGDPQQTPLDLDSDFADIGLDWGIDFLDPSLLRQYGPVIMDA